MNELKVGDKVIYKNRIDNKTLYEVCHVTSDKKLVGVTKIGGNYISPVKPSNLKKV